MALLSFIDLSYGGLKVLSISGASDVSTDFNTVYGGIAGTCVSPSENSVCDSCTGGGSSFEVCNPKRVHSTLKLSISFTVDDEDLAGNSRKVFLQKQDNTLVGDAVEMDLQKGVTYTYTTTWDKICSAFGIAGCAYNAAGVNPTALSLFFGVDTSNDNVVEESGRVSISFRLSAPPSTSAVTSALCPGGVPLSGQGVCYFQVVRGDGKVYVSDFVLSDDYPAVVENTGVTFQAAHFYFAASSSADESADAATLATIRNNSNSVRIPLEEKGTGEHALAENRVSDLENKQRYCFLAVNEDSAGNLYRSTPLAGDISGLCATPGEVTGVLDDKSCFIATAAFGSTWAPPVEVLRRWRDVYMKPSPLGRRWIKKYYTWSPPLAEFISQHETLRGFVRIALWPVVWVAQWTLDWGIWKVLFAVLCGGLFLGFFWMRRVPHHEKV